MKKVYAAKGAAIKFAFEVSKTKSRTCIPWPFCKTGDGYGAVYVNQRTIGAHAYVLRLSTGVPPEGKNQALHSCRDTTCVNPNHLRWGSHQDNSNDMLRDGTNPVGEKNSKAKLSREDIISIRSDDRLHKHIAKQYGVDKTTISNIKVRKTWRHII